MPADEIKEDRVQRRVLPTQYGRTCQALGSWLSPLAPQTSRVFLE